MIVGYVSQNDLKEDLNTLRFQVFLISTVSTFWREMKAREWTH